MGKNIRKIIPLTLVLLYSLSISAHAKAGAFNWLAPRDTQSIVVTSEPHSALENSASFENLFTWNSRQSFEQKNAEPRTEFKVIRTYTVRATGYSSTPDQTDDTPFITASGTYVRDGIIAANFYINGRRVPFGTLVRIPEIYGDKVFIVEDRMNARYTNNIDVWFPDRDLAGSFGSLKVLIEVVEES